MKRNILKRSVSEDLTWAAILKANTDEATQQEEL
jgi:hypothetical protein